MRCLYEGCLRPVKTRGVCNNHYQMWRRGTLPFEPLPATTAKNAEDVFRLYVRPTGFCWEWTGNLDGKGYGRVLIEGQQRRAHRWVYETLVEPIPTDLEMDHLCRNKVCVNPDHVEPVTKSENQIRGRAGSLKPRLLVCQQGHDLSDARNAGKPRREGQSPICLECARQRNRRRYVERKSADG